MLKVVTNEAEKDEESRRRLRWTRVPRVPEARPVRDYVYVWADGVHFNIRLEDDRLCTLVLIGFLPDGTKELIAVKDGYRESTDNWKTLLRDLKRRGMRAPSPWETARGFWGAMRDVWPETRPQRDWCHKMANVLDKLPRRLQPKAKRLLREIMYADTWDQAQEGMQRFAAEYGAKHPKAVETLRKDEEALFTHYDFPAEHWRHLRTTNVIESTFATVRRRQRVTKGAGSRTKGLVMTFKLLDMAQARWRRVTVPSCYRSSAPASHSSMEFSRTWRRRKKTPPDQIPDPQQLTISPSFWEIGGYDRHSKLPTASVHDDEDVTFVG